jgi:outer membrane biosynthesis protein TonB
MSRLEKKCFMGSASVHLVLVLVLLVGPGFITSRNPSDALPVLEVIPANLVDAALAGGGNPNAKPPPPSPIIARETVASTPAPPTVTPRPEPEPVSEPRKPTRTRKSPPREVDETPAREPKPSPVAREPLTKSEQEPPKRKPIEPDLKPVVRGPTTDSAARDRARVAERQRQELAAAAAARRAEIASALQGIRQNLSPGITVDVRGPGGEAYANYGLAVRSIYDHAWMLPDEVTDDSLTVQVIVTIAREGAVVADKTRILRRSGNAVVDRSVQRALDRVKIIGPFPAGAKELEREFIIYFNVKAKRSLG